MPKPSSDFRTHPVLKALQFLAVLTVCTFTLTAGSDCTTYNPQTFLDGSNRPDTSEEVPVVPIDRLDAPNLVTVESVGDTFRIEVRAEGSDGDPLADTEARIHAYFDAAFLELVIACGGQDVDPFYSLGDADIPSRRRVQDCQGLVPAYHAFVNDGVMWFKFRALAEGETSVRFAYPGALVAGFASTPRQPGPFQDPSIRPVEGGYTETVDTQVVIGGAAADSDDDGVPDFEDDCPDTPEGTDVDEDGCPVAGPPPGADVVVVNDINVFDQEAMAEPNNVTLVRNLVDFTTAGSRNAGTKVMFDRGRSSACGSDGACGNTALATMRATIEGEGFTILDQNSSSGSLTSIPADVKTVFLWLPAVAFTNAEVNALKLFASQGGRIVLIGEHVTYYTQAGIDVENDLLDKMGAQMTNTGGSVDCGRVLAPESSLRDHQVTSGMTTVKYGCSSVIDPGPSDFPLWFDQAGTQLLAGVAAVDVTPIGTQLAPAAVRPSSPVQPGVKATSTGD